MALGGVLLAVNANAQVLSTFVREQVGTLPKGRFMVSYLSLNASIDSMYGRNGDSKNLSGNLNQSITFKKITEEDPVRGNQLSGLFLANGVNLGDQAGSLAGSIRGTVNGKVPVIGYGIRDDLGLYVSLPVLTFNINADYQFTPSATTNGLLSQLSANDQSSVASEMGAALNSSLENKLFTAGLGWDPRLNRSYFGDAQVMLLKVIPPAQGKTLKQLLQPMLVLPTASDRDIRDLYGLKAGDGRFGMGFKYALEETLPYRFQLNLGIGATYLFATKQARSLPRGSGDELNELLDPDAQVSGGSKFQSQVQIRYPFPRWVGLNLGVSWQKQLQEALAGNRYQPEVYSVASSRTSYDLVSSYASIDLNSIQSFLEGNFLMPAVAEVGIGLPLAGRNAISEPVLQFQGTMFF
jgi:hypothetical protein